MFRVESIPVGFTYIYIHTFYIDVHIMYAYTYIYMHDIWYFYVSMYLCIIMYLNIYLSIYLSIYIYISKYLCIYISSYLYYIIYINTYICIYLYLYIYTHYIIIFTSEIHTTLLLLCIRPLDAVPPPDRRGCHRSWGHGWVFQDGTVIPICASKWESIIYI